MEQGIPTEFICTDKSNLNSVVQEVNEYCEKSPINFKVLLLQTQEHIKYIYDGRKYKELELRIPRSISINQPIEQENLRLEILTYFFFG